MKFTYNLSALIVAALLLFGCSNNKLSSTNPDSVPPQSGSTMAYWVTTPDESMLLQKQAPIPLSSPVVGQPQIKVDTAQTFQTMDGFGYTLTGGSAHVINNMPAAEKSALLTELFGKGDNAIGINFLRVSIGASDLNATVFTYDDMPVGQTDPDLKNFSLGPDKTSLIPLLKEILAINPTIKILGSPWTPPVWMKDNGSSIGGSLRPEYYDAYAKYFVKYIEAMKAEGINIYAITPQNEPLHPGNNPSLLMLPEQQAAFIKNHLGPAFKSASINTKIIIYDHNCDKPEYPISILNDPEAKQYIDGSAFHLYAGDIKAMSTVHDAHPDKNLYFTEQYTAIESKFSGDLQWHIKNLIVGAPRNWSRTVLEWNLANDASFGPHTPGGCTTCKGALTIDGANVKRNVAYYIIGHASKFVPDGSVRVFSSSPDNLPNVAFKTPEGKIIVIVMNDTNESKTFSISSGDRSASATLSNGAVATFVL